MVENLRVKSSGMLLFGILPVGAFVEPDEEKMAKKPILPQMRILGAGTTSNALFFVVFLLFALALSQALPLLVNGVSVKSVFENSTAFTQIAAGSVVLAANDVKIRTTNDLAQYAQAGVANLRIAGRSDSVKVRLMDLEVASSSNAVLLKGERILEAEGKPVYTTSDLRSALAGKNAGDAISVKTNNGLKSVTLNAQGKLGVTLAARQAVEFQNDASNPFLFGLFSFLLLIIAFTYTLNFILATVNLLPLFFTDGQRMFTLELRKAFGDKLGTKLSIALGLVTLGLLAINALPWFT